MEVIQYPSYEFPSLDTPQTQSSNQDDYIQKEKKAFRCTFPDCGKTFKFKSEISRHQVIHFKSRPFTCPHDGCGKTFKREDALDTHLRLHTKEMPFSCEFPGCDKKFTTKAALKYHALKHNNQRAYTCDFSGCGKSFFTKGQLKQHQKAFNYHLGKDDVTSTKLKEEPTKLISNCTKDEEDFYNYFYAPLTPRVVQNIEWEIKGQEDDIVYDNENKEVVALEDKQDPFAADKQDPFNQIVEKLQEEEDNFFSLNTDWMAPAGEPSLFFDENQFQFLDFLQEQAYDKF